MTRLVGAMAFVCLLGSCSQGDESASDRQLTELKLIPYQQRYVEVDPVSSRDDSGSRSWMSPAVTRSWTIPDGYVPYSSLNGLFATQNDLTDNAIGVFFTRDGREPLEGRFFKGGDQWRSTVDLTAATYYLYGYIPYQGGVTATIAEPVSGGYPGGAVLTLSGLPTVNPNDICVVVGAKNGISADDDDGLSRGQFEYVAAGGSGNYIFLLFDHLYSALRINVKVDADYNALRTIKLKEMTLQGFNGGSAMKSTTTAVVTLTKRTDGTSPITGVTFTPDETSDDVTTTLFSDAAGVALSTTPTDFRGCFMPQGVTRFTLVSRYDVYDKNGNLIRKDCTATNTLNVSTLFNPSTALVRGRMFTINLTVSPTYLYVLSEPDLDNPTMTIE